MLDRQGWFCRHWLRKSTSAGADWETRDGHWRWVARRIEQAGIERLDVPPIEVHTRTLLTQRPYPRFHLVFRPGTSPSLTRDGSLDGTALRAYPASANQRYGQQNDDHDQIDAEDGEQCNQHPRQIPRSAPSAWNKSTTNPTLDRPLSPDSLAHLPGGVAAGQPSPSIREVQLQWPRTRRTSIPRSLPRS